MRKSVLAVSIVLMAATGCNSGGGDRGRDNRQERSEKSEAGEERDNRAEAERSANVVRRPGPEEAQRRLIGAWSRDTDCGRQLVFRGDGSLTAFDGAPGTWTVDGGEDGAMLRMRGEDRTANMEVVLIADDEIQIRDTDAGTQGETIAMRKCE
jgi:hypothetical protein